MSDSSDRPFGHSTLNLRAAFVPDGAEQQVPPGDLVRSVGHGAARLGAAIVPEGGKPPGLPFVRICKVQFRPTRDEATDPTSGNQPPTLPEAASPPTAQDEPTTAPVPAPRMGATGPSRSGLAAWRRLAQPSLLRRAVEQRRGAGNAESAASVAAGPSPEAPERD